MNIQKQPNGSDCGLIAIANALAVCLGIQQFLNLRGGILNKMGGGGGRGGGAEIQ